MKCVLSRNNAHVITDLQIFMNAPRNASAEELKAYLDEACGDDGTLRGRVESLFRADEAAHQFMNHPAVELDEESPSLVIGRYKLLQEIGQGGFGVVYMADQEEPVKRRVALKIIKAGMDTRQVIARFEAERQALAMMDHPNIARVLDGGETNEGRPYFVMELIKGIPITTYCEQEKLPVAARLKLFVQVCRAVQHAHGKGIIHRDLKPSNILITVKDGEPVPKVIDFGIAKAIDQRLTDKTLFTRYEQMIGTPTYMSPEQAALSGVDVDTRCDIYALGVLLYELLTGTTPFDSETLRSAAFDEMRRMIREDEPPKPSTRLSRTVATADVSRKPHMKETVALLRGDLDWIIMKCLEKDRNRRYETANGLCLDIERHLGNEPVLARPPTPWYRLKKLAQRNKVAVGASAIVLAGLWIGLIAALWGLSEANHARRVADAAKGEADEQRERAVHQADQLAARVYLMQLGVADKALLARNYPRARQALDNCAEDRRDWNWRFLNRRYESAIRVVSGSEMPLFTSDGNRLITISTDSESAEAHDVTIWNLPSMSEIGRLSHPNKLYSLALTSNDQWLAGGDTIGHVVLWNLETRETKWKVPVATQRFDGMEFSPDGSVIGTASWDGHLRVLNTSDGSVKFDLELGGQVRKISFSPDGGWVTAGGSRAVVASMNSGKIVAEFPAQTVVTAFSPDGRLIAGGNPQEQRIHLWNWTGEELIHKTSWEAANSSRFSDLRFCNGGTHLASVQGVHVVVWDVGSARRIASLDRPPDALTWWLGVNPKDNAIGFGGSGEVGIWHYQGGDEQISIRPMVSSSRSLQFSPAGSMIAVGSHRGQHGVSAADKDKAGPVIILDAASGNPVATLQGQFSGFSWMPDGQRIIVTSEPTRAHEMYNALSGALLRRFAGNSAAARPYAEKTGQKLISFGKDFIVRTWNVESGEIEEEFSLGTIRGTGDVVAPIGGLWNAVVGPGGRKVAVAQGGDLRIWDLLARQEMPRLLKPGRATETLTFSRDGSRIHAIGNEEDFALFDIDSTQALQRFSGPSGALAVSPNEKQVVSAGEGVVVWNIESGLPLLTLSNGDQDDYRSVDWSPDNRRIAAGSDDGTVRIWTLPVVP